MALENSIDTIHYAILQVLQEPLWKSKIHTTLEEEDDLPIEGAPSIQTIGRRVDELTQNNYVSTTIISPEDVGRDLVIGYIRTEQGDDIVAEKRDEMLHEIAANASNSGHDPQRTVTKPALIRMIVEQFELDADTEDELDTEYEEDGLISLLALHYAQKNADEVTPDQYHAYSDDEVKNFKHLIE